MNVGPPAHSVEQRFRTMLGTVKPAVQPPAASWPRWAVPATLLVAALLRVLRIPLRWDEWTWHYGAYDARTWEALEQGRIGEALTTFSGLHPPLYPLLHSLQELWFPAPGVLLLASALFSLAAVFFVCRLHPVAGLLLATAPIQVAYAAEANNYPLLCGVLGGVFWARERAATGSTAWLGALGALAVWTHFLAGGVAVLACWTLPRPKRWKPLAWIGLAAVPLVLPALALVTEPGTFRQPPVRLGLMGAAFLDRFGPLALLLLPLAWRGVRREPHLAYIWGGTLLTIWGLQLFGIAAPHQFPYYLALGVPGALLVAAGIEKPLHTRLVVAVALAQGAMLGVQNGAAWRALSTEGPRAIDTALAEAQPGDGIYLLAPPRVEDDDKRATSAVLQRISPWQPLPAADPYEFDFLDHRHGQPRQLGEITVYVNDHVRPELSLARNAHKTLFLMVYDHRQDPRYTSDLAASLGQAPEGVGPDLLWRLMSP
jgi:hypothetical protein